MAHADGAVGTQLSVQLTVPDDPREMVNFHNIWIGVGVEPENASANQNGAWVLMILPRGKPQPTMSLAEINLENNNQFIIACGVTTSSNEGPFTLSEQIKTSRNLNPGDALLLIHNQHGVTAGDVSTSLLICAHTTRA